MGELNEFHEASREVLAELLELRAQAKQSGVVKFGEERLRPREIRARVKGMSAEQRGPFMVNYIKENGIDAAMKLARSVEDQDA